MDIKDFKKAIRKVRAASVDDGTVVRWVSGGRYTYVAVYIKAVDKWYISGEARFYGTSIIDRTTFINEVLATADSIEVATEWEEVN